jgi:hypothetical protein
MVSQTTDLLSETYVRVYNARHNNRDARFFSAEDGGISCAQADGKSQANALSDDDPV